MSGSVQMSIRLPVDQADDLARIAAANDRTVSAELRRLIRRYVAAHDSREHHGPATDRATTQNGRSSRTSIGERNGHTGEGSTR